jgi:DnaJ-like protein
MRDHGRVLRPRRAASRAREIDLGSLPYVRLPTAPAHWERRQQQAAEDHAERVWAGAVRAADLRGEGGSARRAAPRFAADGPGWRIISEDKLPLDERPDPAYKDVFPTSGSTFWLDPHGRREGFEDAASVLRVTDRAGSLVAERGLASDVYRADVNADGSAILFMSREGVLHGYSDRIEQILADRIADLPEYRAQAERLGIEPQELKTHARCVAISADRSRYLVTVVDEAWCMSTTSREVLWSIRLPAQQGWTKVATPRMDRSWSSGEIEVALHLMELELPVAPKDITRQYRRLAMRWHPDRNPDDPDATRRFQELAAAMELLTGADLRGIGGRQVEGVTYQKILRHARIDPRVDGRPGNALEITFSMGASEKHAADWIYAAKFGSRQNRAFLAAYSGKVVEVSDRGMPVRVYDLGAVPR